MKRIKMLLYGEPGVGKSVFALKAPKPFFICTDGNYEWLDEFGADPNAHKNVSSWAETKTILESDFKDYETIVIDLLEDCFKWCEQEYCVRNRIEHVYDVGYGKAYDATRNEFFIAISKLLSMDKNVILICHGITFVTKDRRGVEHTRYAPSSRIPDKVLDMIEGRVRYCLRCYTAAEEQPDGKIIKRRFLSLVPKENEFGIIRGVDENSIPHDIPLDFNEFAKAIKYDTTAYSVKQITKETATETTNVVVKEEPKELQTETKSKLELLKAKKAKLDIQSTTTTSQIVKNNEEDVKETKEESKEETSETVEVKVNENAPYVETSQEQPVVQPVTQPVTQNSKLEAIKAKLASMKNNKN